MKFNLDIVLLIWGISFLTTTMLNAITKGKLNGLIGEWERESKWNRRILYIYLFSPFMVGILYFIKWIVG